MSTALVLFGPADRDSGPSVLGQRPSADFMAHLIAAKEQAPQTRARRRADPQAAIAAYRALGRWPTAAGAKLSRSL